MPVYRSGDKNNLLVMTGYCVQGTLGHAVVMGKRDAVPTGDGQTIDVKCAVRNISFRYGLRPNKSLPIGAVCGLDFCHLCIFTII
jgi:Cft2 family RNA processing exonuclease